jgi:hypothetical protein
MWSARIAAARSMLARRSSRTALAGVTQASAGPSCAILLFGARRDLNRRRKGEKGPRYGGSVAAQPSGELMAVATGDVLRDTAHHRCCAP